MMSPYNAAQSYGVQHDIEFNFQRSVVNIAKKPRRIKRKNFPSFFAADVVNKVRYLGHIIRGELLYVMTTMLQTVCTSQYAGVQIPDVYR